MKRIFYDFSITHIVGRKKINLFFLKKIAVISLLLTALFGAIIYFCFLPKKVTFPKREYHYAICSTHTSEAAASEKSEQVRAQGGAGFVIFDQAYLVAVFVYPEKSFAQRVVQNLGGDAFVYTARREAVTLKAKNSVHAQTIGGTNGVIEYAIEQIYLTLISLEKSETTTSVVKNTVFSCSQKIKSLNKKLGKIRKKYLGTDVENLIINCERISTFFEVAYANSGELKLVLCKVAQIFINFTNKTEIV